MDAETHQGHAEAAGVDHLHHPVDAPAVAGGIRRGTSPGRCRSFAPTGQPGSSPVELHLARRHARGPELGLEPLDAKAVGATVGVPAGHDVGRKAAGALRGALRPGEHDEDVGVDVGAEVLLAEEEPLVAVLHGPGGVGTDVAAPLTLGQEHPAFPCVVRVQAGQALQDLVADLGGGVALHDVGRPARHPEAAVHGGLRLAHEVGERGGQGRRHRPPRHVSQADEAMAHQVGLVLDPGGVVLDEPHLPAPPVVVAQDGAVGRRHLGPLGQSLADQGSVGGDVLLGELSVLGVG